MKRENKERMNDLYKLHTKRTILTIQKNTSECIEFPTIQQMG